MAAEPRLDTVFKEVISCRQDQQLALKQPQAYRVPLRTPYLWGQLAEAARRYDDTLLGVVASGGEPQLALEWRQQVEFKPGDALVVLTKGQM